MAELPRRADGLVVSESPDGYVVYDAVRDRVHHLNRTAALVLELCTGENATDDVARAVGAAFGLSEPPGEEVRDCLARLREEGLVGRDGPLPADGESGSVARSNHEQGV